MTDDSFNLTPLDVRTQQFRRTVRGYDPAAIEEFRERIAAEVERIATAGGGRSAFPVIATIHGETLHNHDHSNVMSEGDLFLLDCGAESRLGYAGDLSSTFPVSARFSERQRIIYDLQLLAQNTANDQLRQKLL